MVNKWDDSLIRRIQQANDIVDVVSEYLKLDKKGKEFVGLCPFHSDHRPSLYVSPAKQIFKCFACSAGGDVVKFVQMKEGLTFAQAIHRLAQRAGIALPKRQAEPAESEPKAGLDAALLAKLNAWAMRHWAANLWHEHKGAFARDYLSRRQISEQTARTWGLGLALDSWDDLVRRAQRDGIGEEQLVAAGLAVRREDGGCYDKFRHRLMFPIADPTGRVAGFGGRTLGDDAAKYMNSPATALFDKSRLLYGLRQAREAIVRSGRAVIVEGYTDVLMAHQYGIQEVVAALGTSLTAEHIRLLSRYTHKAVLVFDSDTAGRAAADRALATCLGAKLDVRLAFVPSGKDPCEFLIERGAPAFSALLDQAEDVLAFKWRQLSEQLDSQQGLTERVDKVSQFLDTVASAVFAGQCDSLRQTLLIGQLSQMLSVPKGRIEQELQRRLEQKKTATLAASPQGQPVPSVSGPAEPLPADVVRHAQQEIIEVLLHSPALYEQIAETISAQDFADNPLLSPIAAAVFEMLRTGQAVDLVYLYGRLEEPAAARLLTQLADRAFEKGNAQRRLLDSVQVMVEHRHRQQLEQLKQRAAQDDEAALAALNQRLMARRDNFKRAGLVE